MGGKQPTHEHGEATRSKAEVSMFARVCWFDLISCMFFAFVGVCHSLCHLDNLHIREKISLHGTMYFWEPFVTEHLSVWRYTFTCCALAALFPTSLSLPVNALIGSDVVDVLSFWAQRTLPSHIPPVICLRLESVVPKSARWRTEPWPGCCISFWRYMTYPISNASDFTTSASLSDKLATVSATHGVADTKLKNKIVKSARTQCRLFCSMPPWNQKCASGNWSCSIMESISVHMNVLPTSGVLTTCWYMPFPAMIWCTWLTNSPPNLKILVYNSKQTKPKFTPPSTWEVGGALIEALQGTATHKYLGKLIVGNLKRNRKPNSHIVCRSLGRNFTKTNTSWLTVMFPKSCDWNISMLWFLRLNHFQLLNG